MRAGRRTLILAAAVALVTAACQELPTAGDPLASAPRAALLSGDVAALGERLFEDTNLSVNQNQSCATCHEDDQGYAAPLRGVTTRGSVVEGSIPGEFGDRKPPTTAYATLATRFVDKNKASGGLFWDGRATGHLLGSAAADQALGPFLNPKEQALPDKACLAYRVRTSAYLELYTAAYGDGILTISFPTDVETTCTDNVLARNPGMHVALSAAHRQVVNEVFENAARAIAAFEATQNHFSSPFDTGDLTQLEQRGMRLFNNKGKCAQCHSSKGSQPLFTDLEFHNLGVPRNPDNPYFNYQTMAADPGLGGFTGRASHMGKFRTPTTRNVAQGDNRTYMHNGALISLKQVVDFYNTRDVLPTCTDPAILADPAKWGSYGVGRCWPAPEHPANLDSKNMGKLGLTDAEVDAVVAFLEALTDVEDD
jgi:cytochrome c peroxidase